MSTSIQTFISHATDAVKGFLRKDKSREYSENSRRRGYLNDIARGNWSSLRPTNTRETFTPVVGFPDNYTYPNSNRKINTNFVRYPFLPQINFEIYRQLRHVQTNDKSVYVADKSFKMRPARERLQLLCDIRSFQRSSLNTPRQMSYKGPQSSSKESGATIRAVGINYESQSNANQLPRYLNDIQRGQWKKMNHVSTRESQMPVVGCPSGFNLFRGLKFNTMAPRTPLYLDQIRRGQFNLRRGDRSNNRSNQFGSDFRNWRMSKPLDRSQLLNSIRKFDQSTLNRADINPTFSSNLLYRAKLYILDKSDSTKEEMIVINSYSLSNPQQSQSADYLVDIENRRWDNLKHVDQVKERPGFVGSDWKMGKPVDRAVLLEEVKEGCDLKHVNTVEKGLSLDSDYLVKKNGLQERKNLMNDIRGFESDSLQHVGSS